MKTIGATFSGGGFRATAFSMGCLDYLDSVQLGDDTLLSNVVFSSSTSGGSIAMGLHAALTQQGKTVPEIVAFAREKMQGDVLLSAAIRILHDDATWKDYPTKQRDLINSFAIAYDRDLFKGATLSLFTNPSKGPAIARYCFNTTELNNGQSFRFDLDRDPTFGYVGNYWQHVDRSQRKRLDRVRLADVVAASSCFPGGFEPMVFPNDFENTDPIGLKDTLRDELDQPVRPDRVPFGVLDGGAVDNQGLNGLQLEIGRRIKRNEPLDLVISCDVSSFYIDRYQPPNGDHGWRAGLRLGQLWVGALVAFVSLVIAGIVAVVLHSWVLVTALAPPLAAAIWAAVRIRCALRGSGKDDDWSFMLGRHGKPLLNALHTDAVDYFFSTRARSLGLLVSSVFMNQIRRQHYAALYDGQNHLPTISCFVYELATKNRANLDRRMKEKRKKAEEKGHAAKWDRAVLPLEVSFAQLKVADSAAETETTLWFGPRNAHKPDDLIACGRFTLCFNLLVYLAEVVGEQGVLSPEQEVLRQQLLTDWSHFQKNPLSLLTRRC
jgi:hypothetical protein